MAERKQSGKEPARAGEKGKQARTDENDRLRGDSPNVLPDADPDSCVVVHRRNDKESDS